MRRELTSQAARDLWSLDLAAALDIVRAGGEGGGRGGGGGVPLFDFFEGRLKRSGS